MPDSLPSRWLWTQPVILLALLLAALAGLQGHYILRDGLPLGWDEAYHIGLALETADRITGESTAESGLLDVSAYYPPLTYCLAAPFAVFVNRSVDALLLVQVGLLLLAVGATYGIGKQVADARVGLLSAWMLATAPIVFGCGRTFLLDVPLTALVALALWALLAFIEDPSPRRAVLLGVLTGLAMLCKWTAFIFLLGPLLAFLHERGRGRPLAHPLVYIHDAWRALATLWREHQAVIWGLAAAVLVAVVVSMPWYLQHTHYVIATFAGDPVATGIFARPGTSESLGHLKWLGYHVAALGSNQLHLLPALLVVAGVCLKPRTASPLRVALIYGWLLAFAVFTWIPLKDPRFMMPGLPVLIVAGCDALMRLQPRRLRQAVIAFSLVLGCLQWGMTSYRWFSDRNVMMQTPIGQVTVWGPGWHGNAIHIDEDWPLEALIAAVPPGKPEAPRQITVLSNHIYLQQSNLQVAANMRRIPLEFKYIHNVGRPIEEIAQHAAWMIAKTGDVGPRFSAKGVPELVERLLDPGDPLGQRVEPVLRLPLPDGSEAVVLRAKTAQVG